MAVNVLKSLFWMETIFTMTIYLYFLKLRGIKLNILLALENAVKHCLENKERITITSVSPDKHGCLKIKDLKEENRK